jgi:hypothetical protein
VLGARDKQVCARLARQASARRRSTRALDVMQTHPSKRPDGSVSRFEVSNAIPWSLGPMRRVLTSVAGVSDVHRSRTGDDRWTFSYLGHKCLVHEPWGDNSRYWVMPADPDAAIDLGPVHDAFCSYRLLGGLTPKAKEGA